MRCKICGSMAINPHMHGRDNADLDLCDVCYWRKRANGAKPTLSEGADGGLKACPYCGGSNLTEFNGRIECEGCGAHGPDEQRGICWNDRDFA